MTDMRDIFILTSAVFTLAALWSAVGAHLRLDKLKMLLNDERPYQNKHKF